MEILNDKEGKEKEGGIEMAILGGKKREGVGGKESKLE